MKKKLPAPPLNRCKKFVDCWNELVPTVVEKAKNEKSSLRLLEILCHLYTEYQEIAQEIKDYEVEIRYRTDKDVHKTLEHMYSREAKIYREIRNYNKILGLISVDEPSEAFKKYWDLFYEKVKDRDNFHDSHLKQLKILCDLYVEYDDLSSVLEFEGNTYESDGRYGFKIVERPEVKMKSSVIKEIRSYSKLLDLVLVKDAGSNNDGDNEWTDGN